jgi:PKD repeat protein
MLQSRRAAPVATPSPALPVVPPTASFAASCTALVCVFDASASSGGSTGAAGHGWSFGDGTSGSGVSVTRGYAAPGAYAVNLTVTSESGATATAMRTVTVSSPPPAGIALNASAYRVKRQHTVGLAWSGATSTQVTLYRDGAVLRTLTNTGQYTDSPGATGRASYAYRVCDAAGVPCSPQVTAQFR